MNDTSTLLGQLRIERGNTPPPSRSRWPLFAIAGVLLLALIAYFFLRGPEAVPVKSVTARSISAGGGGASVLDGSGYVIARRQATVSSKITGKVMEVLVEEGQAVKAGDVLARIDDINARAQQLLSQSQLEAARAQLVEVQVQLADAERQLIRNRELAAGKLVSQQALESTQAQVDMLKARLASMQRNVVVAERGVDVQTRNLEDTVVRAPFDGVITVKNAQPGEMISPLSAGGDGTRTGIGTLVDMDSLEIEVDVNENFINRVHADQAVTARLNAYPDWQIPARVIAVVPAADRSKATVRVRVGLEVKDPRILPDMGVRVAFMDEAPATAAAAQQAAVVVPGEALSDNGGSTVVWLLRDDTVERRAVRVDGKLSDGVRISAGLSGGERLAVGDLSRLQDGMRVRVITE